MPREAEHIFFVRNFTSGAFFNVRASVDGMTEPITGLHSVTLHIRDIQKARAFYKDVLGLREISFNEKANRAVFALPGRPSS